MACNTPVIIDTPWGEMPRMEAAERTGINVSTIRQRLQRGWTDIEAVTIPTGGRRRGDEIETPSGPMLIAAAATRYGIIENTLRGRLANGWPELDAVTIATRSPRPDTLIETPWGEKMTVAAAARRSGLGATTVNSRLRSGWDSIEALTLPPMRNGTVRKKGDQKCA